MLAQLFTLSIKGRYDYSHEQVRHEVRPEDDVRNEEDRVDVVLLGARLEVGALRVHRFVHDSRPPNGASLRDHLLEGLPDVVECSVVSFPAAAVVEAIEIVHYDILDLNLGQSDSSRVTNVAIFKFAFEQINSNDAENDHEE